MDYGQLSDEDLVARLAQREIAALELLYARHARVMFALALNVLAERESAEEVVQESFLKLWRNPGAFDRQRGRLLPWLLGVTHHRAIDALRHRKVEARHRVDGAWSAVELVPSTDNPELNAWGNFRAEAVARALQHLPAPQRLALELAYFRGLTQQEIAQQLGEPLGTVKTRIRLALQKLRASVDMQGLRTEEA